MSDHFGIDTGELYRIWVAYNNRMKTARNPRIAISLLQSHPEMYPIETINYFTAIGLELFNREYLEALKNG